MMQTNEIVYNNSKLFYQKYSGSEKVLLVFHGFGLTHENMTKIALSFNQKGYTVYSFDLYFHGKSTFVDIKKPISLNQWKEVLCHFFQREKINQFELLGYSMGSRFSISTLSLFPEKTQKIYLIAPDIIVLSSWYRFATGTMVGNTVFRLFTKYHLFYKFWISFIGYLKLVNTSKVRFAKNRMNLPEEREQVYNSWTFFKKLYVPFNEFSKLIKQNEIEFKLFLGKYDKIVPCDEVINKVRAFGFKDPYVYNTGHNQLIYMDELLNDF